MRALSARGRALRAAAGLGAVAAGLGAGLWVGADRAPAHQAGFRPAQLVIQRIGVRAAVESKGVDRHHVMEAPDQPSDVAWYPFTAEPGAAGNAVFAGHRDYGSAGPAVFWRLSDVRPGDVVEVVGAHGAGARYRVTRTTSYPVASIPMAIILAPARQDEITIMTCAGAFDPAGGYDHRLVVQGTRIT